MRIFLAGATGAIGRHLVVYLISAGHTVAGMTRSYKNAKGLGVLGATAYVCNVYDRSCLEESVSSFGPDLVMHQLTDLPDDPDLVEEFFSRNSRIRSEGTRNLIAAAETVGVTRFFAQSVAWVPPPLAREGVDELEALVLGIHGVVLRYGRFYGPGTYWAEGGLPPTPRVQVVEAARRTVDLLEVSSGIISIVDP